MNETFSKPLNNLVDQNIHTLPSREVSDEQSVLLGVQRVLEGSESGRGFLQEHGSRHEKPPAPANYFASLYSARTRCTFFTFK